MDAMTCLLERRSCRKYKAEQIKAAELDAILKAGTFAASAMGRQPTKIVVLQDPADVAELERLNAKFLGNPEAKPFYGAPTVCLVLAKADVPTGVEDGSLVMGNLMNAAHAVGVASCWIHRAREAMESDEGKALLAKWGVEGEWRGVGHCILGYADGELPPARERKPDFVVKV